ncbi:MAG: hypothetical protein KTR31_03345 [Myxococcales bacterium]|nr:hypothetical protein [Myxococcales bacterium]
MNRMLGAASTGLLVLTAACSGGDAPPVLTPQDDITRPPPVVETGDTGEEPGGRIDAAGAAIFGFFAYDESTQRFVNYGHPDFGLIPSSLEVVFLDSSTATDPVDETNSCRVRLELTSPTPNADWVKEELTAWAGFDVPDDANLVDGCANYSLPSEFGGDVGFHVAKWPWGLGLSPITDETVEALEGGLPPSEWAALQPFAVGGSLVNPLFAKGGSDYTEGGFVLGFEVDGNFQIVLGGTGNPEPILKELINTPDGVATAYYEANYGIAPGTAFTFDP